MKQPSLRDLLDDEALLDRLSRREDPGGDELGVLLAAVVARADAPLSPGRRQAPRRRRLVAAMGLAVAISGAGMAAAMTIPSVAPPATVQPATVQPSVATPSSPAPAGKGASARPWASSGAAVVTEGTVAARRGVPTSGHAAGDVTGAGTATALPPINTGGSDAPRPAQPTSRADAVGSAKPTPVAPSRTEPGARPAANPRTSDSTADTTPNPESNHQGGNKANDKADHKSSNKGSAGATATEGRVEQRSATAPSHPAARSERTAGDSKSTAEAASPATTSRRPSSRGEPVWAGVPGANAHSATQPATAPAP